MVAVIYSVCVFFAGIYDLPENGYSTDYLILGIRLWPSLQHIGCIRSIMLWSRICGLSLFDMFYFMLIAMGISTKSSKGGHGVGMFSSSPARKPHVREHRSQR